MIKIKCISISILILILSCKTRTYSDVFIQDDNQENIPVTGWIKETIYKDKFNTGDLSKFVIHKNYRNDTLLKYIELSSFRTDTTKISSIVIKYFANSSYKEYDDVWQGIYENDIRLTHTCISLTPKTIDSAYFYYRDRSIKRLRYGDKTDSTEFTNIHYKQGAKFVNMARFDSLPGVKEENGYFVFVDE
jgi:hypothetical protein